MVDVTDSSHWVPMRDVPQAADVCWSRMPLCLQEHIPDNFQAYASLYERYLEGDMSKAPATEAPLDISA